MWMCVAGIVTVGCLGRGLGDLLRVLHVYVLSRQARLTSVCMSSVQQVSCTSALYLCISIARPGVAQLLLALLGTPLCNTPIKSAVCTPQDVLVCRSRGCISCVFPVCLQVAALACSSLPAALLPEM